MSQTASVLTVLLKFLSVQNLADEVCFAKLDMFQAYAHRFFCSSLNSGRGLVLVAW